MVYVPVLLDEEFVTWVKERSSSVCALASLDYDRCANGFAELLPIPIH